MSDLVDWFKAQLAFDERVATAAARFQMDGTPHGVIPSEDSIAYWRDYLHRRPAELRSFAYEFGPARVLAEVAAKRQILDEHRAYELNAGKPATCGRCLRLHNQGWKFLPAPCPTIRLLALPYAGNPGYREEWAP